MSELPRVLIADDDAALAENLAEIVEALQVTPIVVATAGEALQRAQQEAISVALLDLRLPDGSGGDLVRALRQQSPFTQTILITGDATVETAAAAVSDGAFAYVLKPFAPEKLLDTVQRAVDQAELFREKERLRCELERSERHHREVVEAVPAFVMALDHDGHIVLWNKRLEDATGFGRAEMLGKDGRAMVESESAMPLPVKGAPPRLVRWEKADVDQDAIYAVGIDVTDEQQMLRRTMRAERLAAVGTMAAGLAHEIRNPLNAALLQLTLLLRRVDKPEIDRAKVRGAAEVIQAEIERLERLVNEFLAFARPRQLSLAPVDVNALCRGVVALLEPEAEAAQVRLEMALEGSLPRVEGDDERLKQVLLNLMRNAIEAMPGGGVLTVRTRTGGDGVEVDIEDTGTGIEDDTSIFDAFFTTKPEGTGLGLSLVHRIVSDHGGHIGVKSEPGCTRFSFTLPAQSAGA